MRMKHRLWTMLLAWVLIIGFCNGGVYAQTEVNSEFNSVQDTLDWYSSATYGISLPIANSALPGRPWSHDLGREDIMNWGMDVQLQKTSEIYNVQYDEAYYDFWCSYAKEMGAAFVVTVLNCANGFSVAPNPVADEYMWEEQGVERGKCNTSVNYINRLYESCEKYGLKLGLYAVSDWGTRHSPVCVGKGNSNTPVTDEYCQRMCDVYKYWSESFGERVSYWWMDGSYMWEGWHEEPLIKLKAAIKAGNPNAIVSFSDGPSDWDNHYMQNDFTANEGYGIEAIPDGRLMNGIQWQRYLPLWEYDGDGSAYAIPEMVEYVRKVRENGGFMHLGSGGTTEVGKGYDSTQTALYKALKKYVIDGEEMPDYIDGSEKIQAGDCTKMIRLAKGALRMENYTCQVEYTYAPRLMDTVPFGSRGLKWNLPSGLGDNKLTVNSEFAGKNGNIELWAGYENIRIPEGTNNIAISVKDYTEAEKEKWSEIILTKENHMEIRIGNEHGDVIADNIKGVGYIDFFKFTDGEYYEEPVEGYHIVNIPIEPLSGEQDIYFVNVIQEGNDNKSVDPCEKMLFTINGKPSKGDIAWYGNAIGSFDGGDEMCFSNLNFGDEGVTALTLWGATGSDFAWQHIDIYVDASAEKGGTKVGTYTQPDNGGWGVFEPVTVNIEKLTGTRDVYLKARGGDGVGDFKYLQFRRNASLGNFINEAKMLNELGVYDGISKEEFNPDLDAEVDRQTGVMMLLKMTGNEDKVMKMSEEEADSLLGHFKDKDDIEAWAKLYVAYAYKIGLIGGTSTDTLDPCGELTGRALCVMVMRYLGENPDYVTATYDLADLGKISYYEADVLKNINLTKNEVVGVVYNAFYAERENNIVAPKEDEEIKYDSVTESIRAVDYDRKSDNAEGIPKIDASGTFLTNLSDGAWACYENIDFGSGANVFEALVAPGVALQYQTISVRLDSPDGEEVCVLEFGKNKVNGIEFEHKTAEMMSVSGVHDVYITSDISAGAGFLKSFKFYNK